MGFNIGNDYFTILVPLKGDRRIGFIASGYKLINVGTEIASAEFPSFGSKDHFRIEWGEREITFLKRGDRNQIYLDGTLLGSIYRNFNNKKVDTIDISEKLPIEIQVFSYFAYKKYSEVSIGI